MSASSNVELVESLIHRDAPPNSGLLSPTTENGRNDPMYAGTDYAEGVCRLTVSANVHLLY